MGAGPLSATVEARADVSYPLPILGESETHTFMVSTEDERSQWLTILLEAKTFVYNAHKVRSTCCNYRCCLTQVY